MSSDMNLGELTARVRAHGYTMHAQLERGFLRVTLERVRRLPTGVVVRSPVSCATARDLETAVSAALRAAEEAA